MTVNRYEDAMIAQIKLLEFTRSNVGRRYIDGFQASMNRQHPPNARMPRGFFHHIQHTTLKDADPIYVSDRALDVVEHATASFKPEKLLFNDPWVPIGFALFPRPVCLDDSPSNPFRADDGHQRVRAISWLPLHSEDLSVGCFWISFYAHIEDDDESVHEAEIAVYGEEGFARKQAMMSSLAPLALAHQFQWSWGETPWEEPSKLPTVEGEDAEQTAARGAAQSGWVQAFWRIASQLIPAKERVPRGVWKDANRKGIDLKDVTVIQLRRTRPGKDHDHDTGRQLRVAHWVRGHWRNQWYPSIKEHRQIWISPFVKGDESMPFQETTRAFEFTR